MIDLDLLAELQSMLAWESDPALTDDEMFRLMRGAGIADRYGNPPELTWWPDESKMLDAFVLPVTPNGHRYIVTVAGYAGSAEPVWPTTSGATVTNGSVTFKESGAPVWRPTYDLNAAAVRGWRWKAGKASSGASIAIGDNRKEQQQIFNHCMLMAKEYRGRQMRVVEVPGSLSLLTPAFVSDELIP